MKKIIALSILLFAFQSNASNHNEKTSHSVKFEKKLDICSITETRNVNGVSVTITATATTCEEVNAKLNKAFKAAAAILSAN